MSDEELMCAVRDGNTRQLGALYQTHQHNIYDYFARMTRDTHLSGDLLQNTFERVLKGKHTYKSSYPFVGWIFRIAKNVMMDHFKGQKMKMVEDGLKYDRGEEMNLDHIEESEIEKALNQIEPHYKEVLILTRYEDLKYREVAEIIGISETGVKTRVHRALKQLRSVYLEIAE